MSGFFAMRAAGPIPRPVLNAAIARSAHRGRARQWNEDGVVLVAFDGRFGSGLAAGEDFVVALDARVDNRAAIDRALGVGCTSDAIRVLLAWRRWGADALQLIEGDFAGAVWDRHRKDLTVFRDPTAGRHALLARAHRRVLAGSSISMLLADRGIDRSADDDWVIAYLTGTPGFAKATGYRGMERLAPGHLARAHDATAWRARRWHHWKIARIRERDDDAYAARFNDVFATAVKHRTHGARHVGVSLSGGLDSTSVAATLRHARPDARISAFCVPFTDPRADERALQELVALRIGAELHWSPLGDLNPFCGDPIETLERLGTPPIAPNQFFVERVAMQGALAGVEVALDGIDGDGVVGGNWTYLSDLAIAGRWSRLRREADALARVHGLHPVAVRARFVRDPLIPAPLRRAIAAARGRGTPNLQPLFRAKAARALAAGPWRPGSSFTANERLLLDPGVAPAVLEAIDEAWMARGIEPAHPFMDRRVIEFCLGLPREQKVRAGYTKIVLRNAMRGVLPAEVTDRAAKAEMGSSFIAGLLRTGWGPLSQGLSIAPSNLSHWLGPNAFTGMVQADGRSLEPYRTAFLAIWRAWADGSATVQPRELVRTPKEAERWGTS